MKAGSDWIRLTAAIKTYSVAVKVVKQYLESHLAQYFGNSLTLLDVRKWTEPLCAFNATTCQLAPYPFCLVEASRR